MTEIYLALLKHNWQIKNYVCLCTWGITYNLHILNVKWLQPSWIIKCLGAWFSSSQCLFVFEYTVRPRSNFIFLNASFQFPTYMFFLSAEDHKRAHLFLCPPSVPLVRMSVYLPALITVTLLYRLKSGSFVVLLSRLVTGEYLRIHINFIFSTVF